MENYNCKNNLINLPRVITALRLAKTGPEWTDIFIKHNRCWSHSKSYILSVFVVYFDQLSGAVHNPKLVETLF